MRIIHIVFFPILLLASFMQVSAETAGTHEAREIAKDAYIWGYPMVDNLRIQYDYFVDRQNPEFKAPYNQLKNIARVFTPEDRAIQTPNSDTPYSMIGLDLRSEPIVFTVPRIEQGRYWSLQLIDLYTHNFDYLGSRATGNGGGSFMVAGSDWQGETPPGIAKVIRCETSLAMGLFRTQLFNPKDLDNVKKIQSQYKVQPLSAFLGKPAPKAAPPIDFPKPLSREDQRSSLLFFNSLNFGLQFCPTHPSEKALMARFSKIGVGAGKTIDPAALSPETKSALEGGIADAWATFARFTKEEVEQGKVDSTDVFGTREFLKGNSLYRMTGAVLGIYGNSKNEAFYPIYRTDADGERLDASKHAYVLRFGPGQLPPVNSFWSLTMYDAESLLVANPLHRYLINSPMLPDLKRDADGGLTLYLQHESPGKDKESNWLPAPNGEFTAIMRLYWPKSEALNGQWKNPLVQKQDQGQQAKKTVTPENYIRAETDRTFRHPDL